MTTETDDGLAPIVPGVRVDHPNWGNQVVLCPRCGDAYLHHGRVVLYLRGEDEEHLLRVTVGMDGAVAREFVSAIGSGTPSRRRHGLAVRFWCENCHGWSELTLSQHKGNTEIAWREPPDGQPPGIPGAEAVV
jgi:hypothetical protein